MKIPGLRSSDPLAVGKRTIKLYLENDMLTYAAALAFQTLFSIFPFLIVIIAILGLFDLMQFYEWLHNQAVVILPPEAMEQVDYVIEEVRDTHGGILSVGLVVAIWVASGAMRVIINALNKVYRVREGRPFWKLYPLSVVYTLCIAVMMISAAILMVLGPQAMSWIAEIFGMEKIIVTIWTWLRLPVALALLTITIAFVYYIGPDVKQKIRFITPGSFLSVIVWAAASIGFAFYIQNFADYSRVYGSIGAVVVLMMYFYISAAVLLFGAELNAVIEDKMPSGKNLGEKKFK